MVLVSRTPTVSIILVFPIVTWQHLFQNDFVDFLMCAPSQIGLQIYHSMLVPCHGTKPSYTKVTRSLSEPWAFLREASVCKKLIPKSVPIRPFFLPQHGSTMTWHHAKFHDFQTCFGFTRILKPSFSMFSAEPRCPDVWIHSHFLHGT